MTGAWARWAVAAACVAAVAGCTNPFAPKLDTGDTGDLGLGDQRTVEGVFRNLRYAYTFKDTLTYGRLLHPEFVFIYRNYEQNVDVTWGRDEEMVSTTSMFNTVQQLDIIWNAVVVSLGDSLVQDVSRGFTLSVIFNPDDVVRVDGRVNFRIVRNDVAEPWQIVQWRDESNF